MLRTSLLRTALGAALLLGPLGAAVSAQAAGTDPGTPPNWLRGIFGEADHAPTSAFPGAARGQDALLPGRGVPTSGGAASDRTLTPDGAILPGTSTPGSHNSSGS
jgi:hypothetical protein